MKLPWATRTVLTASRSGTPFEALDTVRADLHRRGASIGPLQRGAPIAFRFDDCEISKWRHLGKDRRDMHGAIVSDDAGSFRYGPLRVEVRTGLMVPGGEG